MAADVLGAAAGLLQGAASDESRKQIEKAKLDFDAQKENPAAPLERAIPGAINAYAASQKNMIKVTPVVAGLIGDMTGDKDGALKLVNQHIDERILAGMINSGTKLRLMKPIDIVVNGKPHKIIPKFNWQTGEYEPQDLGEAEAKVTSGKTTREIKDGGELVTQERQPDGTWKEIARAPREATDKTKPKMKDIQSRFDKAAQNLQKLSATSKTPISDMISSVINDSSGKLKQGAIGQNLATMKDAYNEAKKNGFDLTIAPEFQSMMGTGNQGNKFTQDVIDYAKKHNITNDQALAIKQARGG